MNAEEVVRALMRLANSSSPKDDMQTIVNAIACEHPTLQQIIIGHLVLNLVRVMHNKHKASQYDGRNQIAVEVCDKMWNAVKDIVSIDDESWTRLALI